MIENPGSILVVTPLNAILEEQQDRFGDACLVIDAAMVHDLEEGNETEATRRLKSGSFQFLLGHPEMVTQSVVKHLLMRPHVSSKVSSCASFFWY